MREASGHVWGLPCLLRVFPELDQALVPAETEHGADSQPQAMHPQACVPSIWVTQLCVPAELGGRGLGGVGTVGGWVAAGCRV